MRPLLLTVALLALALPAWAYDAKAFDADFAHDAGQTEAYRSSYLLAALTEVVYDKANLRKEKWDRLGVSQVAFKNSGKHDAQAALVTTERHIFLVVRGTKQAKDYVQDVRAVKDHNWSSDKIKVHAGFGDQAKALYDWSLREIKRHQGRRKLWITGHSLGGVVGNLLAYRLQRDGGVRVDGVVTFGAPRAGGNGWQGKYNALLGDRSWRWINGQDPIPHEPRSGVWKPVGKRQVIHKGKKLRFTDPPNPNGDWLQFAKRHGSTKYLHGFWDGMPNSEQGDMPRPKLVAPDK